MASTVCEEYASSLNDLTFNSKPHISMLTMLAEENVQYAPQIVQVIEAHLQKVKPEAKLPAIYLIDSIVKNVGSAYLSLFTQNLVSTFCNVFDKVDEKTRIQLFKLRQTWSEVFPNKKLYAIDVRVNQLDPAWPITAQASIHVNPKFLKTPAEEDLRKTYPDLQESEMRKQLIAKQQELLKIQQQKLELELIQAKAKLEEQKRLIEHQHQEKQQPAPQPAKPAEVVAEPVKKVLPVPEPAPAPPVVQRPAAPPPPPPPPPAAAHALPSFPRLPSTVTKVVGKDPRMARDPRLHRDPKSGQTLPMSSVNLPNPSVNIVNPNKISNVITNNKIERNVKDKLESDKETNLNKANVHNKEKNISNHTQKTTDKKKVDKKESKKKPETSVNKKNESKKEDKNDKHKSPLNDKKVKSKSDKNISDNQKGRKSDKSSGRNLGKKIDHKKENSSYRSGFRNQRNYRSNRDRSESPDKFEKTAQKLEEKDQEREKKASDTEKKSNVRCRSRSPIHNERVNEKDDKRSDKVDRKPLDKDKNDYRKKSPRKELDKNKVEHILEKESTKENKPTCNELSSTDVDLRVPLSSIPKLNAVQESNNQEKDNLTPPEEQPPPSKKIKRDDEDASLNDLFGTKDQDYRQLPPSNSRAAMLSRSPGQGGWAQYKTDHPDKFRNSVTPLKDNTRNYCSFGSFDQDFRKLPQPCEFDDSMMESRQKFPRIPQDGRDPRMPRGADPRVARAYNKPWYSNKSLDDPRVLRRHPRYLRFQNEMKNNEDDLHIPHALLLNRQSEILKQADQQLKSGHLTAQQHNEILNQLATLYELQRLKEQQREEQFRERLFKNEYEQRLLQRHFPDYPDIRQFDKGVNFPSVSYNVRISKEKFDASNSPGRDVCLDRSEPDKMTSAAPRIGDNDHYNQDSGMERQTMNFKEPSNVGEPTLTVKPDSTQDVMSNIPENFLENKSDINKIETKNNASAEHAIQIDGKLMRLKYIGSVAVIIDGNEAKEIFFKSGVRDVTIDDLTLSLKFGEEKSFEMDGSSHLIRFGVPRRELYINNIPYEVRFGGPPIEVKLNNNNIHQLRASGPPPDVEFKELDSHIKELLKDDEKEINSGMPPEKVKPESCEIASSLPPRPLPLPSSNIENTELPLNKADLPNVITNEKMDIDSRPFSPLPQDDQDYRTKFNFIPEVHKEDVPPRDQKYTREKEWNDQWREEPYLKDEHQHPNERLNVRNTSELPHRDEVPPEFWPRRPPMFRDRGTRLPNPPRMMDYGPPHDGPPLPPRDMPYREHSMPRYRPGPRVRYENHHPPHYDGMRPRFEPMRPRFDGMIMRPRMDRGGHARPPGYFSPNNPDFLRGNYPPHRPPDFFGPIRDRPVMPVPPPISEPLPNTEQKVSSTPPLAAAQPINQPLDITDLFQKLVQAGIIPSSAQPASQESEDAKQEPAVKEKTEQTEEEEEESEDDKVPTLEFTSECLRTHYAGVIGHLYRGIQCSSCGLRFTAEQTEKYAQHLDWHFRHNRRERDSAKKAVSRKWYYDVQDWIQFEEVEDMEDRARSLFEVQAVEDHTEHMEDTPSVPVGGEDEDNFCVVCREAFEQFWDQEKEEWHLRDATRIEDKTYHPACYEDIRNPRLQESSAEETETQKGETSNKEETEGKESTSVKEEVHNKEEVKSQEEVSASVDAEEKMEVDQEATVPVKVDIKEEKEVSVKEEPHVEKETKVAEVIAPSPPVNELERPVATDVKEIKSERLSELSNELPDEDSNGLVINLNINTNNELEEQVVDKLNVQPNLLLVNSSSSSELQNDSPVVVSDVKTEPVDQVSDSDNTHLVPVTEELTLPSSSSSLSSSDAGLLVRIKTEPSEESEKPLCTSLTNLGPVEDRGGLQCEHDDGDVVKMNIDVDKVTRDSNVVSTVDTVTPIKIENNEIVADKPANKDVVSMSDSRFTILPPVQRGTELSGLCTIL